MTREEEWLLAEKYDGDLGAPGFAIDRARLKAGEPVAYVIGWQPFLGLTIRLDSHPLIPRPETEWWTEHLLANVGPRRSYIRFLDLCAGSGAIGCAALARLPEARVYFGELDPAHAATIRKNIRENGLDESRADVRIGDLFAPFGALTFDVVAANPPYIPASRALDASVTKHEPHAALFSGDDGLALIRRIAEELPHRMNPGGVAYVECDTAHAPRARALFAASGLRAEIVHDQYGVPRIIVVRFP